MSRFILFSVAVIALGLYLSNDRPNQYVEFDQHALYNYLGDSVFSCRLLEETEDTVIFSFRYRDFGGSLESGYHCFNSTQHFPVGIMKISSDGKVSIAGDMSVWLKDFIETDHQFIMEMKIHDPNWHVGDSIVSILDANHESSFYTLYLNHMEIDHDTIYHYQVSGLFETVFGYLFSPRRGFYGVYEYNKLNGFPYYFGDHRCISKLNLNHLDSIRVY